MRRTTALLCATLLTCPALAADEAILNTRSILAGTVAKGGTAYKDYLAGKKDGTAAFKGALAAYRALDLVQRVVVTPDPPLPAWPEVGSVKEIASNFNEADFLVPSWGTGAIAAKANDVVGAFRIICAAGALNYDDAIMYPGQPGKSHLHDYAGNTGANAYSTHESLRTTGESTCNNKLYRTVYWAPAMYNGKGQVVRPDYWAIYYKRLPENDPECARQGVKCIDLPAGFRAIYGYNMATGQAAPLQAAYWDCDGPTAKPGHYADMIEAGKNCPAGNRLGFVINAPTCSNGQLDSPDHRSHLAFGSYGDWGYYKCPPTHPYVLPSLQQGVWYNVDDCLNRTGVWDGALDGFCHLSSDRPDAMPGMTMTAKRPGSTGHADIMEALPKTIRDAFHQNCINKILTCTGGDLGNGKQLKQVWPVTMSNGAPVANPRLVPVPARPAS